jgi:hypothetical protein
MGFPINSVVGGTSCCWRFLYSLTAWDRALHTVLSVLSVPSPDLLLTAASAPSGVSVKQEFPLINLPKEVKWPAPFT